MMKAFVDTTVLTNILLKTGKLADDCKAALEGFSETQLPVYAIKEFKAGPLHYFAWFHNKLVTLNSYWEAINALQQMSTTPRRYLPSTALQALKEAAFTMKSTPLGKLAEKYGEDASEDAVLRDQYRLAVKNAVYRAWRQRRKITSHIVIPLECYSETDPTDKRGLINLTPTRCDARRQCGLSVMLKERPGDLQKLRDVVKELPQSRENLRRYRALRHLCRKPKQPLTRELCTDLGDATFVLTAPHDAVILTTNIRDHAPLASVLGKRVESPATPVQT